MMVALQAPVASPAAPTPAEPDRPITHFFQNLAKDLISLPSTGSTIMLAAGSGVALGVRPVDDNLTTWADEQGAAGYTRFGRVLGDGWVQGGAALTTYAIGLVTKHRPTRHVGSDLIRAQALNAVITRAAKAAVGRRRPGGSRDSLPSGHASASFASAAVLGSHFGWKVGVPAYAVAGFVGWTRVRDHAHWPTDVVVGATTGLIAGYTVARGHGPRNWAIVPSAGARQVAITVVRLSR
jgi:membrane-associated phospholipid phosphatase